MKVSRKLAALGLGTAMLGAFGVPALALSSGVTVSFLSSAPAGGRTLTLQDPQGTTLSNLDMSTGTNSFVAKVIDTNYVNNGYNVQATMSNLYGFNSGTWTCAQKVASSAVSMSSPSGLLDVSGVTSTLTPVFQLSGSLSSIGGVLALAAPITGASPGGNSVVGADTSPLASLTQGQVAGAGNTGDLFGTTLAGLLSKLPISVATAAGGAFTTPAADPTGSGCNQSTGVGATNIPVMSGTANLAGLIQDVQGLVTTATGTSAPTATQLVSAGYITSGSVLSMVSSALGIPVSLLTPLLTQIEGALSDNLLTAPLTLVSGLTGQSGTYSAQPGVAVNTSGIPAGSYHGTLTVTLVDAP